MGTAGKFDFESYHLGIDDIDDQHRALLNCIANLDIAIAGGDPRVALQNALDELDHLTDIHFSVEESLMRICRYPALEEHITLHADFVEKVHQLRQKSAVSDIAQDASEFLHQWLMQHILVEDRKYAEYFLALSECIGRTP